MEWHIILAAVATGTTLHAVMEPDNIMRKLKRLAQAISSGKVAELPMKGINTRPKSYALGVVVISLFVTIAYFIINAINPSVEGALQYSVAALLLGELLLMVKIDQYHVLIEKVTQKQKRKK